LKLLGQIPPEKEIRKMTDPEFTLAGHLPTIVGECALPGPGAPVASDRDGIRLALRWAMQTAGLSEPNPTVGCVIVAGGRVVAGGSTLAAGDLHAERVALGRLPKGCNLGAATLYTTLEPCAHIGRQPPCCDAVVAAGIGRCVVGLRDPDERVDGRGIERLTRAGLGVEAALMRAECAMWHLPFLSRFRLKRPFVALKWAQTLDGQLAYDTNHPKWITGSSAKRYAHWLRQRYDAIVIGAGTTINDCARLNVRHVSGRKHRDPIRIIVDPNGRVLSSERWDHILLAPLSPEGSAIYLGPPHAKGRAAVRLAELARRNNILVHQHSPGHSLVKSILEVVCDPEIASRFGRTIHSLMVEGGPRLHRLFLDAGVADVAHVLVAPGFGSGLRHRIAPDWRPERRLSVTGSYILGNDVLIEMAGPEAKQLIEARTKAAVHDQSRPEMERTE
jgi:diaminohydroxyphosphoribosylaminopyrimidine deaminase / 5-amino-6-(5-phosphoribosylamino)uracil reductase